MEYEAAKRRLLDAQEAMQVASLNEVRRLVHEEFPTATRFSLFGSYGDESGELRIELYKVEGRHQDDYESWDELLEQCDPPLLYLAGVSGEDFLFEHDVRIVDRCECEDTGFLVGQTYGYAVLPDGWTSVQACDGCNRVSTDEDAANAAAQRVVSDGLAPSCSVRYFPAPVDVDDDDVHPGDWAFGEETS